MAGELTPRQRQVLQLIVGGYTGQEIAERLRISAVAVAFHRRDLLKKLRARNTADLIIRAHRGGMSKPGGEAKTCARRSGGLAAVFLVGSGFNLIEPAHFLAKVLFHSPALSGSTGALR